MGQDPIQLDDGRADVSYHDASPIRAGDVAAGRYSNQPKQEDSVQATVRWLSRELETLRAQDQALLQQTARYAGAIAQINEQLRQASQIQRDLLPDPLPRVQGARCRVLYRPADRVSGDIYNVERLDETHLALTLADATGHGVPAALLSAFVKQAVRGTADRDGRQVLIPPVEVVGRLNRELVDTNLSNAEFVAIAYAVYDGESRRLTWVRGGIPFPILVRPGEAPTPIHSDGTVIGAVDAPPLESVELDLRPGDAVVFYTDGLESLLLGSEPGPTPIDITGTPWFQSLIDTPIAEAFDRINGMLDEWSPTESQLDDVTLLAIEVTG